MAKMARDRVVKRAKNVVFLTDMGGSFLISNGIWCRDSFRRIGHRPQLNHQPVWQAGDGQPGIADEALVDAELVRAVCGDDGDAARTHFNLIDTAVFPCDGESADFLYIVQWDALNQYSVLKDICDVMPALPAAEQENDACQA